MIGNISGASGGGIHHNTKGTLTLTGSTVSNNSANLGGGGIRIHGATASLTNSTISNNAAFGGEGGGILNSGAVVALTILNSTVSANTAAFGGGGGGSNGTLQNSIVAANVPADCSGTMVSLDHNLDSDSSCNLGGANDLPGVDPLLGPLANNGGPTETHALLTGSPAIDAGDDSAAPATDQRGLPRVGTSDIGAFERQGVDADGDGIADDIDTDPTTFSDAFDDGAGNFGTVTNRDGLTVSVTDDPGDGVIIQVAGGAGTVTVSLCGGFQLNLTAGDGVGISCGSVTVTVTVGPVELPLPDGMSVVSIDSGAIATVSNNGDGTYTVASEPDSSADVTVTTDGTESVLSPGESTTFEVAAQGPPPPPPHAFVGSAADATVDGDPLEPGTLLEAVDADGNVIATATWRDDGLWSIEVPAGEFRFRVGAAVSEPFTVAPGEFTPGLFTLDVALTLVSAAEREASLTSGFNFVTYTGPGGATPADILAQISDPSAVTVINQFDRATQQWLSYRPTAPPFLNDAIVIAQNSVIGISVAADVVWTMPLAPIDAAGGTLTYALATGFTAVPWLESSPGDAKTIFQRTPPGSVSAIYRFNNVVKQWDIARPGSLAFLNTLQAANQYDALFIQATVPGTYTQVIE